MPGQDWPHRLDDDGNWVHPDNSNEYAEGITAEPRTTEELIKAGAQRLPAIVRLVGDHEQERLAAAAQQGPLSGIEDRDWGDQDCPADGEVPGGQPSPESTENQDEEGRDLSGLSDEELEARLPSLVVAQEQNQQS